MNLNPVVPSADRGYYRIEGLPTWAGCDRPSYLASYVRTHGTTDGSREAAQAVLMFRLAEMSVWRRLMWRAGRWLVRTSERNLP